MKTTCIVIYFVFAFFAGVSQNTRPIVVCDAVTYVGIPFATIKVLNKANGTYADEAGKFSVNASEKDSLIVTCVGYQPEIVMLKHDTILLKPRAIQLNEIKVKPSNGKEHTFGLFKSRTSLKHFFVGDINYELALKISIPEEYSSYRLKGVKLDALNTKAKSLARLHIYNQNEDGLPDKELLTHDVIINNSFQSNSVIDLSWQSLVLDDRVLFIGIEAIKGEISYKPLSGNCIGFGFTMDEKEPTTYSRAFNDPKYRWRLEYSKSFVKHLHNKTGNPANLKGSLIID